MKKRLCVKELTLRRTPLEISNDVYIFNPPKSLDDFNANFEFLSECEQIEYRIPYAGLGYGLSSSTFFDTARMFNVFRLEHISQLEYLEDPGLSSNAMGLSTHFSHSRYQHSSNVCLIASAITYVNRNWFSKRQGFKETLIVAALTHDTLTPAGGDTTKAIDREGFDEDAEYHTLMTEERREFLREQNVDPELCIKTVEGKGVLGTLLDIADKLAYVGHDLKAFLGTGIKTHLSIFKDDLIRQYLKNDPLPCRLWEHVRISGEKVWFTDKEALTRFLVIRAKLFRYLYTHPKARYREALVMYCTLSFLYQTGRLTKAQLLKIEDGRLRNVLHDLIGWKFDSLLPFKQGFKAKHRGFKSIEAAKVFANKLRCKGHTFVRVEDLQKVFKPATHFNVRKNRSIGSLQKLYPDLAQVVVDTGQTINPIRVSFLEGKEPNLGPLTDEFRTWAKTQTP